MTVGDPAATPLRSREAGERSADGARRCAPLRDGPRWERRVRPVLALLVVALYAFWIAGAVGGSRFVQGGSIHGTLVNHVADGRVTTIDLTDDRYVQWRLRDGTVYAERRYPELTDARATVEAQPYVRARPGEIRYARIAAPVGDPYGRGGDAPFEVVAGALLGLFVVVAIGTGPEPRHLTRWGWVWASLTGIGFVAYLLLSGSRRRTQDASPPRIGGLRVLAVVVPSLLLVAYAVPWNLEPLNNEEPRSDTAPAVLVRA